MVFFMFSALPTPGYFAHRGASAYAPENTLAAFDLALRQGAPAVELDAKLTSDGQVIVFHDLELDRTTDAHGPLRGLPLSALRELDAGSWFSADYRNQKIPTLDEVFETIGRKLFINIELTNYATPFDALVPAVAVLVKKHHLENHILFSSFYPWNLARAAHLLPQVPCALLAYPGKFGLWQRAAAQWMPLSAEHPFWEDVNPASLKAAHRRRRRIHAWTVNDPADMRRLWQMGVDALFTDDPIMANIELENLK